ncbi:hypothetical protein ACOSQ3_025997 [Xanthoceras sorbifolium]
MHSLQTPFFKICVLQCLWCQFFSSCESLCPGRLLVPEMTMKLATPLLKSKHINVRVSLPPKKIQFDREVVLILWKKRDFFLSSTRYPVPHTYPPKNNCIPQNSVRLTCLHYFHKMVSQLDHELSNNVSLV